MWQREKKNHHEKPFSPWKIAWRAWEKIQEESAPFWHEKKWEKKRREKKGSSPKIFPDSFMRAFERKREKSLSSSFSYKSSLRSKTMFQIWRRNQINLQEGLLQGHYHPSEDATSDSIRRASLTPIEVGYVCSSTRTLSNYSNHRSWWIAIHTKISRSDLDFVFRQNLI